MPPSILDKYRQQSEEYDPLITRLEEDSLSKYKDAYSDETNYSPSNAFLSSILRLAPMLVGMAVMGKKGAVVGGQAGAEGDKAYRGSLKEKLDATRKQSLIEAELNAQKAKEFRGDKRKAEDSALDAELRLDIEDRKDARAGSTRTGGGLDRENAKREAFMIKLASAPTQDQRDRLTQVGIQLGYIDEGSHFDENTSKDVGLEDQLDIDRKKQLLSKGGLDIELKKLGLSKGEQDLIRGELSQQIQKQSLTKGDLDITLKEMGIKEGELDLKSKAQGLLKGEQSLSKGALDIELKKKGLDKAGQSLVKGDLDIRAKQAGLDKGSLDVQKKQQDIEQNNLAKTARDRQLAVGAIVMRPGEGVTDDMAEVASELARHYTSAINGMQKLRNLAEKKGRVGRVFATSPAEIDTLTQSIVSALTDARATGLKGSKAVGSEYRDAKVNIPTIYGSLTNLTDATNPFTPHMLDTLDAQIKQFEEDAVRNISGFSYSPVDFEQERDVDTANKYLDENPEELISGYAKLNGLTLEQAKAKLSAALGRE